MAIQAVPAYLQNASHSAALFRQAMSNPYSVAGVLAAGEFAVGAQSTPNMSVQVGAGRAKVAGTQISPPTLLSGATAAFTTQAMYDVLNDSSVTLTIATADPTNPRIDTVYVAVQDSYYSGSNNQAVLGVVTGTPAPSPVAAAAPSNSLVVAYVAVAANATSIVAGNVTSNAVSAAVFGAVDARTSTTRSLTPTYRVGSASGTTSAGGDLTVAFPTAFPNNCWGVVVTDSNTGSGIGLVGLKVMSKSTTQFVVRHYSPSSGSTLNSFSSTLTYAAFGE